MSIKQLGDIKDSSTVPPIDIASLPADLGSSVRFGLPADEEMNAVAALRSHSDPWAMRGETPEQTLEALTKLRPFVHVARLNGQVVGYVTVERDGPVQGAAYMRNIPAVSFYRYVGFTTVATVVSKKSGKLRLLMSREL
jgi:ribosomal-protein-alanine N-acetyltransferase